MRYKVYSGQALAIVLIVLVISLILGMAMFSRVAKENLRVVDEKSSGEAIEAADSVLDRIKGVTVSKMKTVCSQIAYGGGLSSTNECKADGITEVNSFLSDLGVGGDITNSLNNCQSNSSDLEVSVKLAGSNDALEMAPDTVRSFILNGNLPTPAACSLQLSFTPLGTSVAGVQISKIYGETYSNGLPANFSDYVANDILQYCIYSTGTDCSSNPNFLDTWTPRASGSQINVSLDRVAVGSDYKYLDEIRIRPIGGSVSMKYSLSVANCLADNEMIKVTSNANCSGSSRAKEIQIPQQDWAGSIFDYVLFNGKGSVTIQ